MLNSCNEFSYNYTFYGFDKYKGSTQRLIDFDSKKSENIRIAEYSNATIIPYKEEVYNQQILYPRIGGVVDNELNIIPDSCSYWTDINAKDGMHIGKIISEINHQNLLSSPDTVVYLGHSDNHFGHFLIDSMQRFYIIDKFTNNKIKFAYIGNCESKYKELFYLSGINPSRLIHIVDPIKFKKVIVCSPTSKYPCWYDVNFKKGFDNIRKNLDKNTPSINKIYFSRTRLNSYGKVYGEQAFEKIFERNGYTIIYPELLPLKLQISLVQKCKVIAGTSGSAMHLALFAPDNTHCFYLERSEHISKCQFLIVDRLKNIQATYIESFINPIPVNECSCPYIIGLNRYVKDFFNDHNFSFSDTDFENTNDYLLDFFDHWYEAKLNLSGNYAIKSTGMTKEGLNTLYTAAKNRRCSKLIWKTRLERLNNLLCLAT